jgi:anhydro-N-acetylmuramic acid kinase
MITDFLRSIKKQKLRRILVLSAGGLYSGIQGIYLENEGDNWTIGAHSFVPYPQPVNDALARLSNPAQSIMPAESALLDRRISLLLCDCAKNVLAQIPETHKPPLFSIVNNLSLLQELAPPGAASERWNVIFGDPHCLALSLRIPVLAGLSRHNLLTGTKSDSLLLAGHSKIAGKTEGDFVLVNIGLIARIVVVRKSESAPAIDSDTGPGTCLIDAAARECNSPDPFDRDGNFAAQGHIDNNALDTLVSQEWFSLPIPKEASQALLASLSSHESLAGLSPVDKLATLTALTARTIFDVFKREYKDLTSLKTFWIAGGGSHNQTLMKYLQAYVGSIAVKPISDMGIPVDAYIPAALGLSISSYIDTLEKGGKQEGWGTWIDV